MADKPTILLIDDDRNFLRIVQLHLQKTERFVVETATSADHALERIQRTTPDLIILDLRMPGKSGFWLYHQMKLDEETANIPVIVLSGMITQEENQILSNRDDETGLIALGKPVDPNVLLTTIVAELRRSEASIAT